ncbi:MULTISPECIES: sugar ABC transporter substrate-binding protein [unclassified Mesorhizobium]|uniref:sugar ABC transporter substrate-binding protein n=1 Tax=unclassified Mesorhizobium TaxID=325217 RepID=UPI00112A509F|nr:MULTISPECIES: sugar ABC transporter substrate-binding protein [unclassified Mesorhizobium]TPJ46034.1 ABC transporter substrate-binding protein [Mesorhizobium sp. B2-6-6]MCA0008528.1 ABC transporter substrate-binding protein [Mesorhizobium sp. B264B1B]MCA0018874.1 ABC transporter substrate-binding protein [Mesorhizobium sp. B264B1A]MCA0025747.1 ABC transporter substrate-binding protein [Mesorhizobium sp. B263B1A]MCA0058558.1 ABC transporter substrate-binding protein [Mesorhizobium sp. B261B1
MKNASRRLTYGRAAIAATLLGLGTSSANAQDTYKVFLNMSYSGNTWQASAANGIKALASTPPYDNQVEFKTIISGTDVQKQISDLQSMIAAGANAILLYPLSPTALNRTIKQACDQGVVVFTYDSTVTESCAHNVSNITARYGANTAQWMVNQMGGKGELIFNHGVAGTTVTKTYDEQAYGVFKKYPDIKIVGDFYGNWNDATSQEEVAKILAAHPNVDGIWTVDGTFGSLQAVINSRPDKLVVIAGQSNNGYRLAMADPAMQAKGLKGVSSSAGPAVGGYAFKLMMEVVTGKKKLTANNIEYPLPWVEPQDVKLCQGETFVDGCNTFPADKVPPLFIDTSLNGDLLPELSLKSVQDGTPTPGATIKDLPDVTYADNLPGINCGKCEPTKGWLEPNKVKPIPAP